MNTIFDKTDKGREEIASRKYKLPARARSLLLLVDGKHTVDEVLKQTSGLGVNSQHVVELLERGFIQCAEAEDLYEDDEGDLPEEEAQLDVAADVSSEASPALKGTATATDSPADSVPRKLPGGVTHAQAIYNFYTRTIGETLGLRGYLLQLKVERAVSLTDYRALRTPYIEAIYKSKGSATARALRDQLDRLLYCGKKPNSKTSNQTSIMLAQDSIVST